MSTTNTMHPKPVQVRMKAETHRWLREQAQAQERSVNWIINCILDKARAANGHGQNLLRANPEANDAKARQTTLEVMERGSK